MKKTHDLESFVPKNLEKQNLPALFQSVAKPFVEGALPPCCTHPQCPKRFENPELERWCRPHTSFVRRSGERIQRWMCFQNPNDKGHTFSAASFEATYWLKRRDLLPKLAQGVTEGVSLRGLARTHEISQQCVSTQVMRIGRICLELSMHALKKIPKGRLGTIVFDELESWEVSQFSPTTHALFMDSESGYKLFLHSTPINRKGRMTDEQKRDYETWVGRHGKNKKSASFTQICELLKMLGKTYGAKNDLHFVTDEKESYIHAIRRVIGNELKISFTHTRFSGKVARTVGVMGKINQEDQYLRQRCGTMRRETLDFMKRHANTNLRHAIYLIKRNFVMPAQGTRRSETPATRLGLMKRAVAWSELLTSRILMDPKKMLPDFLLQTYFQARGTKFYPKTQRFSCSFVT